jgi:uncharacterized membrane protein
MEKTPDEILEIARQQLAARKAAEVLIAERVVGDRYTRDRPWRAAFVGALAVLLLALLFTPGMSVSEKMFAVASGICAQEHTISLDGLLFPTCARNTGIYASVTITLLYLIFTGRSRAGRIPPPATCVALVTFVTLMAVDGFNSVAVDVGITPLYQPQNILRTLTGLGMGVTLGTVVLLLLNSALRRDVDANQPVLGGWRDLGAVLGLCLLVLAAIYGNIIWLYWPLAFMAWGGILGVMFAVNLLLVSVIMRYDGTVTRPAELARPATIALCTTLTLVLGLAALRIWLTSKGLMAG